LTFDFFARRGARAFRVSVTDPIHEQLRPWNWRSGAVLV